MSKYFHPSLPLPLDKILGNINIPHEIVGNANIEVLELASLNASKSGSLSFLMDEKYAADYDETQASVVVVSKNLLSEVKERGDITKIIVENAQSVFVGLVDALYPNKDYFNLLGRGQKSGYNGATVSIEAEVGVGTIVSPGAFIGRGVKVGKNCFIGPNVVITHAKIGDNCIIERNTSIGQDGFGCFRHGDIVLKVKQIGGVVIGDHVEIGANCSIDRGTIDNTIISDYSKLDNQIQIAHNVILGDAAIMAATSAIAGSTTVGKHVTIAGQAGLAGHITVGDYVTIAAKAGVTKNVDDKKTVAGYPATDINIWKKECIALKKLIKKKK